MVRPLLRNWQIRNERLRQTDKKLEWDSQKNRQKDGQTENRKELCSLKQQKFIDTRRRHLSCKKTSKKNRKNGFESACFLKTDPDPTLFQEPDPDATTFWKRIRTRLYFKNRIWIRNPALNYWCSRSMSVSLKTSTRIACTYCREAYSWDWVCLWVKNAFVLYFWLWNIITEPQNIKTYNV